MKKLRVAVIGCGRISVMHLVPASYLEEAELVACCDIKEDRAKAAAEEYGIKASSIGSPIGKIKITDDFAPHFEKYKRIVKTAKMLDCKYIRMFSFFKDGDWTEEKIREIANAIREAKQ